jgi:hypothetical protein
MYPDCCYCEHCQEKFRRKYGQPIPKEDWKNDLWKRFLLFREESMAEFLRDARASLKEINPDGVIFLNGGGWQASGWRVARDIQKVGPFEDFNGAEEFFHPRLVVHNLFASAIMAKYLVAGGKPAVVFTHHALGSWHYKLLPPWEVKLAIAQTVACGANPWFSFFDRADEHDESGVRAVQEVQGFLDKNEEYYEGSSSVATVALHHSSQSATFYISEQPELYRDLGTGKEQDLIADLGTGKTTIDWPRRKKICEAVQESSFIGYCNIMFRNHIPFDVVLDNGLTDERLSRYETLILPNSACLSDSQVQAIEKFVDAGGRLIASFESGLFNESGEPRKVPSLDKVLGIEEREGMFPAIVGENYMRVVQNYSALRTGFLLPRGPHCLKVKPRKQAKIPIVFLEPIPSPYMHLTDESSYPSLILSSFGSGRSAYFPQLMGAFYATNKIEDIERLVVSTIEGISERIPIEVKAPPTVLVDVRSQERPSPRTMIHLVNCTGDMQRPVTDVMPMADIALRIRSPSSRSVRKLTDREETRFERQGEWLEFKLPRLSFYEVIVVE